MNTTILVVDDDAAVRESLGKVLTQAGYKVMMAADGQEAIDRFDPEQIDLMLLDLGLPVRNGWDTFEHITRQNPLLPIIIITGQTHNYEAVDAVGVGAFMEKPLGAPQLLATIRTLLPESKITGLRRLNGDTRNVRQIPFSGALFIQRLRERYSTPFRFTLASGEAEERGELVRPNMKGKL